MLFYINTKASPKKEVIITFLVVKSYTCFISINFLTSTAFDTLFYVDYRLQLSVFINEAIGDKIHTQTIFPLYILLARQDPTPNGEVLIWKNLVDVLMYHVYLYILFWNVIFHWLLSCVQYCRHYDLARIALKRPSSWLLQMELKQTLLCLRLKNYQQKSRIDLFPYC